MDVNQEYSVDDSIKCQKQQAPSSQDASHCSKLSGKPDAIVKATEGLTRNGTTVVPEEMTEFSTICSLRAITFHTSSFIPMP